MCSAPTIYRVLVQQDLSNFQPLALRSCVAAGEPLNPEVIAIWKTATGITIRDGYGQTETVLLCGNFPGVAVKPGSMGLPSPGFELGVIDETGTELPPGQEGDIAVRIETQRPLGLFGGYWNNPQETQAAVRNGWYVTGDRALIDDEGYFWFVGRADDVITSSAYRIGPFEVESVGADRAPGRGRGGSGRQAGSNAGPSRQSVRRAGGRIHSDRQPEGRIARTRQTIDRALQISTGN